VGAFWRLGDPAWISLSGQPDSAHGKSAVIGRQNPAVAPGQFAARKRYRRNVSLKSGTTSSNPSSSRGESTNHRFLRRFHGLVFRVARPARSWTATD
jgi:hypothetical protein